MAPQWRWLAAWFVAIFPSSQFSLYCGIRFGWDMLTCAPWGRASSPMNTRILAIIICLFPTFVTAQSSPRPFKSCKKADGEVRKAWESPAAIPAIRTYIEHCPVEITPEQNVRLLGQLGKLLVRAGNYSEARPILRECREISTAHGFRGDLAFCWEQSGEIAALQGACDAANMAFKATIDVPTTDNLSAAAQELAEEWRGFLNSARINNGVLQIPAPMSPNQHPETVHCDYIEPVGEIQ